MAGYAEEYPTVFGTSIGTSLANAMDTARGGQFMTIPVPYPSGAWLPMMMILVIMIVWRRNIYIGL